MSQLTAEIAKERVARGAALLDAKLPGWADRIDVGTLSLRSSDCCISGQLKRHYGDYQIGGSWENWREHGLVTDEKDGGRQYEEPDFSGRYQMLQDAWIDAIADRVVPKSIASVSPVVVPVPA